MMKVKVLKRGDADKRLLEQARRLGKKVETGLGDAAVVLKDESLKLVPRDSEYLSETARVSQEGHGFATVMCVGYGGLDFPPKAVFSHKENKIVIREPKSYAVWVHQIPAVHNAPEQDDYLEEPRKSKHTEMITALNAAL